jgi:CRP/FNR family cyclic AMP-dependent transcriptional regulator
MNDSAHPAHRPFLDRLDASGRTQLMSLVQYHEFTADQVISRQGDDGDTAMIVDSGIVKVTVSSATGEEVLLGLYGRGELLGEVSALSGGCRSASVIGHLPGGMLTIPANAFRGLLGSQPLLLAAMLSASAHRLRHADHHRLSFAAYNVRTRVATILLAWAYEYGRQTTEGIEIGLRASRRELAQAVAASEKTVDDVLTELRRAAIVRTGRRRFVICDRIGLERWAATEDV